ncbi:MAG TPA: Mut7-C RNAse domain-containing protein [Candidatus Acidoferrales bacterium]|nr:Mut7-C RNAse domain-containing protein [Candidatus Acidoferrales bacterium]
MKFLVDRMLGNLTSWLRILGYDTVSANSFVGMSNPAEDTFMLKLSGLEGRALLTRDMALHYRASQKYRIPSLLIEGGDVLHQLNQVRHEFGLIFPEQPDAVRCTICNGCLYQAGIHEVLQSSEIAKLRTKGVDIRAFIKRHANYLKCDHCGKLFWQGQHWRNMLQMTRHLSKVD